MVERQVISSFNYLIGVLGYYHDNDIRVGDPNEGKWEDCHWPIPKSLGGTETVRLLREHHCYLDALRSIELNGRYYWSDAWNIVPTEIADKLREIPPFETINEDIRERMEKSQQERVLREGNGHPFKQPKSIEHIQNIVIARKTWKPPKDPFCPHCGKQLKASRNGRKLHVLRCSKNPNPKPIPQSQCPHCGKIGATSIMQRWHFDKCRHK